MDIANIAGRFQHNGQAIAALLAGVTPAQARWKPGAADWSILEIVNHLADEEVEDFRRRVDLTLHHEGEPWPPIDPVAWAVERRYNDRGLDESLARFLEARRTSIAWLEQLESPDWQRVYRHPKVGALSAGDLLASWLAHDMLHIRQLAKRHFQFLGESLPGFSLAYAGDW